MSDKVDLNIRLDESEFEELSEFKERRGLTWAGVLKHGTIVGADA